MLNFLGPIANLANTFVEGRVEKTKAVAKAKVARAEAEAEVMKVAATHEAGWEKIMAEASQDSWKDEAWTIFFIVVLSCCFLPWTQGYVKEGFIFLDTSTPDWFANCIDISITASFGYRIGKAGVGMINSVKKNPGSQTKQKIVKKKG